MALTPTEREEHFFKAMVDAADGSTPEELEPTERKEHWYKEIIDAIAAGGGGSGGGVLVVHEVDEYGDTLLSGILPNVNGYAWRTEVESGHNVYYIDVAVELGDADIDDIYVLIGDMRFYNDDMTRLSYSNGVLSIKAGWGGQYYPGYDIVTSESMIVGKNITVYANLVKRLDKTYEEITDAGFAVLYLDANGHGTRVQTLMAFGNSGTSMFLVGFGQNNTYFADDPNGYPVRQNN